MDPIKQIDVHKVKEFEDAFKEYKSIQYSTAVNSCTAALHLSLMALDLKQGDEVIGNETRVKVIKNKVAPPFKQAEFQIMYGKGIYHMGEVIDLGVQLNLVDKAGAWYSYKGERIGQGKKNACEYITENSHIAVDIEQQIRAKLLDHDEGSEDEDMDNVTPISGA